MGSTPTRSLNFNRSRQSRRALWGNSSDFTVSPVGQNCYPADEPATEKRFAGSLLILPPKGWRNSYAADEIRGTLQISSTRCPSPAASCFPERRAGLQYVIIFSPSRQNDLSLRRRGTAGLFDTERKSCRSGHPLYRTKLNVRYTLFPDCYYPCANRRLLARINDPKLVIVSRVRSRDRNEPEQSALSLRVPNDDRGRFRVIVNLSL